MLKLLNILGPFSHWDKLYFKEDIIAKNINVIVI